MRRDHEPGFEPADLRLIAHLHGGFPLSERPYAEVAAALGCSEAEMLERLRHLLAHGVLTRFGPLFQIERAGGCFVLAALAVPEARFDAVATAVNAFPEVAHNYRRASAGSAAPEPGAALNMWFVVATETPAAADAALDRIEAATGLPVWRFPKEREFVVELRLPIAEVAHGAV